MKRKEKRDEEQTKPRISYKEKIKSHKFTVFYRTFLVLALLMAVGAVLLIQWQNKVYTENVEISSVEIKIPSNAEMMPFATHLTSRASIMY